MADPFVGKGPALRAFVNALAAVRVDFAPFECRVDLVANRNTTAIVLEVPTGQIGEGRVGVWAFISRHGHAPQRQVARAAWPLMKHLFVRDNHVGARLDEDQPTCDREKARKRIVVNVAQVARLTGSVGDPLLEGRHVASLVLPDILRFTLGISASFGFAKVNGLGLGDPAYDVVLSIFANRGIAGAVVIDSEVHPRLFPYLAPRHTDQARAPLISRSGRRSTRRPQNRPRAHSTLRGDRAAGPVADRFAAIEPL